MKTIFSCIIGIAFYFSAFTHHAEGGLILTITPNAPTYSLGDTGQLDVFISGQNDELDSFLLGVNITGGSGIVFDDPQNEGFLTDPNYVFLDRSFSVINGLPATFVDPGFAYVTIGDLSDDGFGGSDPFLFAGDQRLIAQLTFSVLSDGNYEFTIDPLSSFSDATFAPIDASFHSASISVTAVPEPSSWMLFTVGMVIPALIRRATNRPRSLVRPA